jgi:hypothetical protein
MGVRCFDGALIQLTLIGTSQYERAEKRPVIHLDRQLGAAWSSVYASSKSHIVIKFGAVPRRDRDELNRQLINERSAYDKLRPIAGWVVPNLYGEYEWYGGRALVLSDGGSILSDLEDFSSLWLMQRYDLPQFNEICADSYMTESSCFVDYTRSTGAESSTETSHRGTWSKNGVFF